MLTSNPYGRYQPILLDAGVPYSLKGAELTQYFLPQNLQASGLGSGSFNQGAGGSNRKLHLMILLSKYLKEEDMLEEMGMELLQLDWRDCQHGK